MSMSICISLPCLILFFPSSQTFTQQKDNDSTSEQSISQLKAYLQVDVKKRPKLAEQQFASVSLSREEAETVKQLLWQDHVQRVKKSRLPEMISRKVSVGNAHMPFYYSVNGKIPNDGRSLYISMHGGGGTAKRINDQQWENQKILYRIPEGVYLVPRAPTNTWNMWHQGHIDPLFDRLIENLIVFENVNPNRVYLLGYSAGGDGVYQLAPRMADRFAAASMMAGHPNDATPLGLRNLPFTIQMGGRDAAYKRNTRAKEWGKQLDDLQTEDPKGYVHWTKMYPNKAHWMDRLDAVALPWMAKHTRNPVPKKIVWKQSKILHSRFYWLAVDDDNRQRGALVRAHLSGQEIEVQSDDVKKLIIRADDRMLNPDENVRIVSQGIQLYYGPMRRTIATIAKTLAERGDPQSVFCSEVIVTMPEKKE